MISGRTTYTERTSYAPLMEILKDDLGAEGAQEVNIAGGSQPDILFKFEGKTWLLSVKLNEKADFKNADWVQYLRHKDEKDFDAGILLVLNKEEFKKIPISSMGADLTSEIRKIKCSVYLDFGSKPATEKNITFPEICNKILQSQRALQQSYSVSHVIDELRDLTIELQKNVNLTNKATLKIITDKNLLADIGKMNIGDIQTSSTFLAAYILISQILFLRLFSRTRKKIVGTLPDSITKKWLRERFQKISDINYRPVYGIDVLDAIPPAFIEKAFWTIWKLRIENYNTELPGRIFHELMPKRIQKLLAAFYTRPIAASILARLVIQKSDNTIIDPSCGSGTILVEGYKRKKELANPNHDPNILHKQFCEEQIFGSEIMPFGTHLTAANLAAINPASTIKTAQIIEQDSLKLVTDSLYTPGIATQTTLFQQSYGMPEEKQGKATTMQGKKFEMKLPQVDCLLMNPPFTKMERGIQKHIELSRFSTMCGLEIGLWGHFLPLAHTLVKEDGMIGAVIPINVLRGRESNLIRKFMIENWTIKYILKPVVNYAFSENSEYRDVLFIAQKKKPKDNHKIKVVLIKKDLKTMLEPESKYCADMVLTQTTKNHKYVDIRSIALAEFRDHFPNMMWFINQSSMNDSEILRRFVKTLPNHLENPSVKYFRDGYGPRPKGVSSFMFITREFHQSRTEEAFLKFKNDKGSIIEAVDKNRTHHKLEKSSFVPSIRTSVGHNRMDISSRLDYLAKEPYEGLDEVMKSSGWTRPPRFKFGNYWKKISHELDKCSCNLVINRRFGPTSTNLISFFSKKKFVPNDTLNVVLEPNPTKAKALCVIMNSIVYLSQFYLLKQDTTGRYTDIRHYDIAEARVLCNNDKIVESLAKIFEKFAKTDFPLLRDQLDDKFDKRYSEFWEPIRMSRRKPGQTRLSPVGRLKPDVIPMKVRLDFDVAVCSALKISISKKKIIELYSVIVRSMIANRGLTTSES